MSEKTMPIVGVEKLYCALLKKDDSTGVEYEKPIYLEGIKEIGIKPKVTQDEFYAENTLWTSESTLSSVDVEVDITDLNEDNEALLLGHKKAKEGGLIYSADDVAPEVAILFKSNKAKGSNRYVVLYKGSFAVSDEGYKGKEGKSNFQSKKLKATFGTLHNNKRWKYKVDSEQGMTDDKFFKEVIMPTIVDKTEIQK